MLKNLGKYNAFHLAALYLKIMFNGASDIVSPIYFTTLMLLIFQISVGAYKIDSDMIIGVMLTAIILSLIMSADLIQKDKKDGMLDLIYISGINPYWFLIIKLFLFILIAIIIALVMLIISTLMFSMGYEVLLSIILPVLMMLPVVAVVILFISLITLGFPNKLAQYILSLPLIVPALIFCSYAISDKTYLMLLLGLNLIYIPLFLFFARLVLVYVIAS